MTVEKPEECLAKLSVHETVRDGITAARDVGEQLHQANACAPDHGINQFWGEKIPSIDHVQRRPADEKFQHDYEQHSDHLEIKCNGFFSSTLRLNDDKLGCKHDGLEFPYYVMEFHHACGISLKNKYFNFCSRPCL